MKKFLLYFINRIKLLYYLLVVTIFLWKFLPIDLISYFTILTLSFSAILIGLWILFASKLLLRTKWKLPDYLMLAFAIWQLLSIFQINSQVDEKPKDGLHIMSYNTMSLLYKKVHRYDDNHDAIAKFIKKENPDIICLQETYWKNWNFGYPYQGKSHSSYSILSKYPVINDGVLPIVNNKLKPFHFADIVWKKDTIRVINMHMASYKFTKDNYDLIKLDKTEQEEVTNGVISILRKLKKGLKKKQKQLKVLLPFIKKSPYPVFLCGDLNDISHSNTYHQIKNLLNDSHKSAGFGLGSSIHTVPFPLRIDYIFYSKEYRCVNHTILSKKLSDHLAISAYFVKK